MKSFPLKSTLFSVMGWFLVCASGWAVDGRPPRVVPDVDLRGPRSHRNKEGGCFVHSWDGCFYVAGEPMYLKATRRGFDYAVRTDAAGAFTARPHGDVEEVNMDYALAYRVFAGYRWRGNWDLTGSYEYFDHSERDFFMAGGAGEVAPTRGLPSVIASAYDSASARGAVTWRQGSLVLGKRWCHHCDGRVRPYAGLRGLSLEQDFDVRYVAAQTDQVDERSELWGVGPVLGIEGDGNCLCFIGIFGRAAMALLYADVDTRQNQFANGVQEVQQRYRYCTVLPIMEMAVGMQYTCGAVQVKLGYEFQYWLGAATSLRANGTTTGAFFPAEYDLAFSGGVFRMEMGF